VGEVSPALAQARGCFVTLTIHGTLRGCVGHILPQESLYQAVVDNTQSAARRDPRFPPVQPEEVDKIHIEVSVLTEPQPMRFVSPEDLLSQLKPYEDGVVLRIGSTGATFLPQVWAQIPEKVEFLNQLSQKAGCAPPAWRGKDTSVSIYHVESFEEPE
jgi:AmmeMemoRadiSam system protein A